jgi:hypothetical protein
MPALKIKHHKVFHAGRLQVGLIFGSKVTLVKHLTVLFFMNRHLALLTNIRLS